MGFLKKSNAPSELPNLAIDGLASSEPVKEPQAVAPSKPSDPSPVQDKPVVAAPVVAPVVEEKKEAPVENHSEVSHEKAVVPPHKDIEKVIDENILGDDKSMRTGFFDEILEDINGGIEDTEKLEDWYEKKFMKEDIVGNMKGYWEGNKADIIIKSFGAEYKKQIKDKVKSLRELEEDWREVYFRLVKKEEEMKKEERELKEIVSEFVNLCKRRNHNEEGEKGKE